MSAGTVHTRPLRVLIVDDEYHARAELRFRLARHEDVEITGEAATASEALRLIEGLDYDVVFLDIAMPGVSGIDLARRLKDRAGAPAVIFVTAYDEYALAAFETRALDYLLKPFDDERLAEALARVRQRRDLRDQARGGRGDDEPAARGGDARRERAPRWLMGYRDQTAMPIPLDEVVFISAEQERVYIHTPRERHPSRYTLRDLEAMLPPERFFRCHRAFIVNLARVREISPGCNGTYTLTMADREGTVVPVARSRVPELKRLFLA